MVGPAVNTESDTERDFPPPHAPYRFISASSLWREIPFPFRLRKSGACGSEDLATSGRNNFYLIVAEELVARPGALHPSAENPAAFHVDLAGAKHTDLARA